jgi:phosphoglycerol transferase MdoB-like AlkP superfamily enzyme
VKILIIEDSTSLRRSLKIGLSNLGFTVDDTGDGSEGLTMALSGDYSLGKFIDKAKKQPYWKDTIFLIVADHDAKASGQNLVPIKNFHIPAVILNSGRQATFDERIVSQIDLAPKLLSLMGIKNYSPMLAHDLNNSNYSGRAMMQYAENFAYMKDNEVTILQPQKEPMNFIYNLKEKTLTLTKSDSKLSEIALAHVLWGSLAYENKWFSNQ